MTSTAARTGRAASGRTRTAGSLGSALGNLLLTLASIGGVICILAVLAAWWFNISLIMFSTGSMSPTITTGSVAVVREIPSSQVQVGDVVTVDRPGQLPVTHRVRGVQDGPGDVRVLTLRGDANAQDDPVDYPVSTVRIVLFSVPHLASVIVQLGNPLVLGAITLAMTLLVMWAFWPRRSRDTPDDAPPEDAPPDDALTDDAPKDDQPDDDARPPPGRHRARSVASAVAALGVAAALLTPAPSVRADVTERIVQGPILRLTTIGDDAAMADLRPGVPVRWQVGASAQVAEPGTVDLSVLVSGALAASSQGLQLRVSTCAERWRGSRCELDPAVVVPSGPAARFAGEVLPAGRMTTDQQRWVLVEAWLPSGAGDQQGLSASVRVAATGVGDTLVSGPAGTLPNTGFGPGVRVVLLGGLLALAAGLLMTGLGRRRTKEIPCGV